MYERLDITKVGLSSKAALENLATYGKNVIPKQGKFSLFASFLAQFTSPLVYILIFALGIDLYVWGFDKEIPYESIMILAILLINALLGVFQEAKSENSLKKLEKYAGKLTWVVRDHKLIQIPSSDIVPEDVIKINHGDRIAADVKIISQNALSIDESSLTGESVPIDKSTNEFAYSGTMAVRGEGYGQVINTGLKSKVGNVASILLNIKDETSPLEKKIISFSKKISIVILLLALIIMVSGLFLTGIDNFNKILLFAIALAVAAIPEALPAIMTMTLSLGVERLAIKKAVVRKLSSVQSLGSVTVILTDKTGTLTENKMIVKDIISDDINLAYKCSALALEIDLKTKQGSIIEKGIIDYLDSKDVILEDYAENYTKHEILPFDSKWKYMRVVACEKNKNLVAYYKGAPEVLLSKSNLSNYEKEKWLDEVSKHAANGFRILALASKNVEKKESVIDEDLCFIGIVLFWDPARAEVKEAIENTKKAGIRIVMITGDHPTTADAIAKSIGIDSPMVLTSEDINNASNFDYINNCNIFARVKPEDKLLLVEKLKEMGEIVAVTGDGVNDSPALKAADVGVAMGIRGSDVAKEVSDIILLDDNFATIVTAIFEGRNILANIKKVIRYLFSSNLIEVLLVFFGFGLCYLLQIKDVDQSILLPLLAVQILWINLITDSIPALSLGLDKNKNLLDIPPPSPSLPLLDKISIRYILSISIFCTFIGLGLIIYLNFESHPGKSIQTILFGYLTIVQLLLIISSRKLDYKPRFNPFLFVSLFVGIILQIIAITNPWFIKFLSLKSLNISDAITIALAVAIGFIASITIAKCINFLNYKEPIF